PRPLGSAAQVQFPTSLIYWVLVSSLLVRILSSRKKVILSFFLFLRFSTQKSNLTVGFPSLLSPVYSSALESSFKSILRIFLNSSLLGLTQITFTSPRPTIFSNSCCVLTLPPIPNCSLIIS